MQNGKTAAQKAWDYCFQKLYCEKTHLIYDFHIARQNPSESGDLPTPEQIRAAYPNPCGYGTGMEDSALNGGILLDTVIRRYEVTGEEFLRSYAEDLFCGLYLCATVGTRGFVARSVCLSDGVSHYVNSSRDQYTNLVYGLWRFYHAALSREEHKEKIRRVLSDIAERLLCEVTRENRYALLRDDGKPGIACEMWGDLAPHEFLRMPMLYAAAYDVTGNEKYRTEYEKYRDAAIEKSLPIRCENLWHLYAALQMQFSVRLLYDFESEKDYRDRYFRLLETVGEYCRLYVLHNAETLCSGDLTRFQYIYEPWNSLPLKPAEQFGDRFAAKPLRNEDNPAFYPLRDFGNAAHTAALCPGKADAELARAFFSVLDMLDYENHSSGGPLDLLGGYWAIEKALHKET